MFLLMTTPIFAEHTNAERIESLERARLVVQALRDLEHGTLTSREIDACMVVERLLIEAGEAIFEGSKE